MAHPTMVAQRQAIALQRLMAAARTVAKQHDLKEQGQALETIKAKDPALAQMQQTEALADLLEGLAAARPAESAQEEQPPVTVETVVEKPLETVETVKIVPAAESPIGVGVMKGKRN